MSIPKSDWIWQNGGFVKWDNATVHVTAHALHYGSSVFEGLRAYDTPRGTAILGLLPHVRRLFDSCRVLHMELPYRSEQVSSAILETVRSVDKLKIGDGARGPITRKLQDAFYGILNGTVPDRHAWLTMIT